MHSKLKVIIGLSVVGVLMPFLGIPIVWKMWISALLAIMVGFFAYRLLQEAPASFIKDTSEQFYAENKPPVDSIKQEQPQKLNVHDEA